MSENGVASATSQLQDSPFSRVSPGSFALVLPTLSCWIEKPVAHDNRCTPFCTGTRRGVKPTEAKASEDVDTLYTFADCALDCSKFLFTFDEAKPVGVEGAIVEWITENTHSGPPLSPDDSLAYAINMAAAISAPQLARRDTVTVNDGIRKLAPSKELSPLQKRNRGESTRKLLKDQAIGEKSKPVDTKTYGIRDVEKLKSPSNRSIAKRVSSRMFLVDSESSPTPPPAVETPAQLSGSELSMTPIALSNFLEDFLGRDVGDVDVGLVKKPTAIDDPSKKIPTKQESPATARKQLPAVPPKKKPLPVPKKPDYVVSALRNSPSPLARNSDPGLLRKASDVNIKKPRALKKGEPPVPSDSPVVKCLDAKLHSSDFGVLQHSGSDKMANGQSDTQREDVSSESITVGSQTEISNESLPLRRPDPEDSEDLSREPSQGRKPETPKSPSKARKSEKPTSRRKVELGTFAEYAPAAMHSTSQESLPKTRGKESAPDFTAEISPVRSSNTRIESPTISPSSLQPSFVVSQEVPSAMDISQSNSSIVLKRNLNSSTRSEAGADSHPTSCGSDSPSLESASIALVSLRGDSRTLLSDGTNKATAPSPRGIKNPRRVSDSRRKLHKEAEEVFEQSAAKAQASHEESSHTTTEPQPQQQPQPQSQQQQQNALETTSPSSSLDPLTRRFKAIGVDALITRPGRRAYQIGDLGLGLPTGHDEASAVSGALTTSTPAETDSDSSNSLDPLTRRFKNAGVDSLVSRSGRRSAFVFEDMAKSQELLATSSAANENK